jgi:hypothetical protein
MRSYLEKTHHKKRAGGMAQGVGSEFKSPKQTLRLARIYNYLIKIFEGKLFVDGISLT